MESLPLVAVVPIVAVAILGIVRGLDVRLVLFAAAGVIGAISGDLRPVLRTFLETFSNEKFVVPICTAMGFAYVLKHTGCDAQLVNLLVGPVRRVRFLMVPGVVLAGFIVNIPVVSQSSTAVCLGTVVVPLMRSAGFSPLTIGASLLLGASVGGELLNPSAVELLAVKAKTGTDLRVLSWVYIPPLVFPVLVISTLLLWWLSRRAGSGGDATTGEELPPQRSRINVFQALVPLVPLLLLFLSGPPLEWLKVPADWVAVATSNTPQPGRVANSRLIGLAMLIGVAVAALVVPRKASGCMRAFFEGAGYAFTHVISLIVVAQCFGAALTQVGLAEVLGRFIENNPDALEPLAAVVPFLFAVLCGSGIASSQSLYPFFYEPAVAVGENPDDVGALVSVGSAAGRTLSPVSAVALLCGTLAGVKATDLSKRLAVPLILGLTVTVVIHLVRQWLG
jgi:DcuC family C4-dicarboxylate transporter